MGVSRGLYFASHFIIGKGGCPRCQTRTVCRRPSVKTKLADLRAGDMVDELDGFRFNRAIPRLCDACKTGSLGEEIIPVAFVIDVISISSSACANRHVDRPTAFISRVTVNECPKVECDPRVGHENEVVERFRNEKLCAPFGYVGVRIADQTDSGHPWIGQQNARFRAGKCDAENVKVIACVYVFEFDVERRFGFHMNRLRSANGWFIRHRSQT